MTSSKNCCAPNAFPASGDQAEDLATIAKALGHPARVKILRLLTQRGTCISGDLSQEVGLAPSTVSEHLRILKECCLVEGTVDGPKRCYCVNAETLKYMKGLLGELGL